MSENDTSVPTKPITENLAVTETVVIASKEEPEELGRQNEQSEQGESDQEDTSESQVAEEEGKEDAMNLAVLAVADPEELYQLLACQPEYYLPLVRHCTKKEIPNMNMIFGRTLGGTQTLKFKIYPNDRWETIGEFEYLSDKEFYEEFTQRVELLLKRSTAMIESGRRPHLALELGSGNDITASDFIGKKNEIVPQPDPKLLAGKAAIGDGDLPRPAPVWNREAPINLSGLGNSMPGAGGAGGEAGSKRENSAEETSLLEGLRKLRGRGSLPPQLMATAPHLMPSSAPNTAVNSPSLPKPLGVVVRDASTGNQFMGPSSGTRVGVDQGLSSFQGEQASREAELFLFIGELLRRMEPLVRSEQLARGSPENRLWIALANSFAPKEVRTALGEIQSSLWHPQKLRCRESDEELWCSKLGLNEIERGVLSRYGLQLTQLWNDLRCGE